VVPKKLEAALRALRSRVEKHFDHKALQQLSLAQDTWAEVWPCLSTCPLFLSLSLFLSFFLSFSLSSFLSFFLLTSPHLHSTFSLKTTQKTYDSCRPLQLKEHVRATLLFISEPILQSFQVMIRPSTEQLDALFKAL
jgi:hypothetical protein